MENEIKQSYTIPSKEDLKEVPKNKAIEAIVLSVEVKTWREIISPEKIDKFDNPNEPQIIITFEADGIKRNEKYKFEEKPFTTSKLGRYIVRYDKPTVGQKITVDFDGDGKSEILLAK